MNPNRSTSRRARAVLGAAVVACAVTAVASAAATAVPVGPTVATGGLGVGVGVERISVATDEGYGAASITPDGRSVVFTSLKNAQGGNAVHVLDRDTGQTRTEPMTEVRTPAISGDGRQVAATTPGDIRTGLRIQQNSLDLGALPANCSRCDYPSLSADGRYLAFSVLVKPGLFRHVIVADRNGGFETVAALSTMVPTRQSISGDGRYVAYQDVGYPQEDVRIRDRTAGTTSAPLEGPSKAASLVQLSDDGSKVVYLSGADTYVHDVASGSAQLVPNVKGVAIDPTGRYLLYAPVGTTGPSLVLRDLQTGTDETVSDQPATAEVDSVSAGGRDVVFQSAADGIVPGDTNGKSDVFVRRFF
ncbi:hypothetical protein [Streptomyces sp. NPDC050504]|uniref:hypothetical protein n=1 Tax=Streptomyces sp. NPDC050504 TaxID=3365618 RepID=UPI00378D2861